MCISKNKLHKGGAIIDTQSYMYQLTINAPIEKGFTHKYIIEIIRNNFKTISYFCMADEEGSLYKKVREMGVRRV